MGGMDVDIALILIPKSFIEEQCIATLCYVERGVELEMF